MPAVAFGKRKANALSDQGNAPLPLRCGRAVAEDARGQQEDRLDQGDDAIHQGADDAEGDRQQPEDWPQDQQDQGNRPGEHKQDGPEQQDKKCAHRDQSPSGSGSRNRRAGL